MVSSDYNRKLVVFDYIANKVVRQVEGAGHTFCFASNPARIIAINDMEIKVYALKGLQLLGSFETEQYL